MAKSRSPIYSNQQPGGLVTLIDIRELSGDTWFVDSNHAAASDAAGYGHSPDSPFASLLYAVTSSAAGDTILLMPGHAETIEDSDEAVLSKAGQRIIGIGDGPRQPTYTLGTATDAAIAVTAANVLIRNIRVVSDLADVAAGITLAATADGAVIENCVLSDGAAAKELVIGISIAAACDNVTIRDNKFYTTPGGGCASAIKCVGATDKLVIDNNVAHGDYSVACLDAATAAGTLMIVRNNALCNVDDGAGLSVSLHASTTGIVEKNSLGGSKGTTVALVAAGAFCFENYVTDNEAESGVLQPDATGLD